MKTFKNIKMMNLRWKNKVTVSSVLQKNNVQIYRKLSHYVPREKNSAKYEPIN